MKRILVIALIVALAFASLALGAWSWGAMLGDLTWQGWLALCLGVLGTAGLGAGLMALVFFSDSSGHDAKTFETPETHTEKPADPE